MHCCCFYHGSNSRTALLVASGFCNAGCFPRVSNAVQSKQVCKIRSKCRWVSQTKGLFGGSVVKEVAAGGEWWGGKKLSSPSRSPPLCLLQHSQPFFLHVGFKNIQSSSAISDFPITAFRDFQIFQRLPFRLLRNYSSWAQHCLQLFWSPWYLFTIACCLSAGRRCCSRLRMCLCCV